MRGRRPHGTGSISETATGGHQGAISLGGRRYQVSARTRDECGAKLYRLRIQYLEGAGVPTQTTRAYRLSKRKGLTIRQIIERVLDDAHRNGWDGGQFTDVLVAQLTPSRRRLGIYGPCGYCGNWIADSVDHVTPQSRGGRTIRSNLVSACLTCNISKGHRTPEEWRTATEVVA